MEVITTLHEAYRKEFGMRGKRIIIMTAIAGVISAIFYRIFKGYMLALCISEGLVLSMYSGWLWCYILWLVAGWQKKVVSK